MRLLPAFLVLISLSGCTEMVIKDFVGGPEVCPSNEYNIVFQNRRDFLGVRHGMTKYSVLNMYFRNKPEFKEEYFLEGGRVVEGYYFQTSEDPSCAHSKDERIVHVPVFFENQLLIGKGYEFYQTDVQPNIMVHDRLSLMARNEPPKTMIDYFTGIFGY